MKPQISIRQIEVFRAVMVAGSVVGGAKLLSVTQPGVSRTLASLEIRLGYLLFERRGRRLVPTAEAQALFREVEHLYVGVDRVAQLAGDLRHQKAGALRVATLPALSQWLVPQAISRFVRERPQVTVFVQSLPSRQIADLVATRQFDLGFVELPLTMPSVRIQPFPAVPLVAAIPRKHPLAKRRKVSVKDLHGQSMLMLSPHSFVRYQIDQAFTSAGLSPRVVVETANSSMVCALAEAGAGIGLVSRWAAASVSTAAVAVLPLQEVLLSRYAAIYSESVPISGLAQSFLDEMRGLLDSV